MPLPNGYLLDANILLALVRDNDLGKYLDATYGLTTRANVSFVCIVTVGEMYALAMKFKWGAAKQTVLNAVLNRYLWIDLDDPALLHAYAEIDAASEEAGFQIGKNDVWIAATARVTNTTLLTIDKDFDHLHGAWIDPEWVDPASKLGP